MATMAEETVVTHKSQRRRGNKNIDSLTQLHSAAVNGDKSYLARMIVSSQKDLDAGDQFGRTPLMFSILADRGECAELLIRAGADVNKKDKGGRTGLHWAAHKGNFRMLKLLLSKGANWKEKDTEGQTALHLCTRHKAPKCLALLLKQVLPGEIDDQDKTKRTSLHWSASYGNLDHIKMLLKQDANIGIPDNEGKTPLHWAASSHDSQAMNCVKLLLETAPSVINWQDYEGRTALHLAVAEGNEAIVEALTNLEKCNVSALDNMFRTPLHWAAVLGHSNIVQLLLDHSADSSSSDTNGATALHYAAQNNHAETVEVFLQRKGMRDEPDNDGRNAFMWACGKGADSVIKCWFRYGASIHEVDKNGGTALHSAALAGHASTVKLLLDNKAQIDSIDLSKHTPLFRASEMGHTDVVQTLIDAGARVDMVDEEGRSPLHWAALGGHSYICQILIKYGVDPNIRDLSGRTPLHCASYGGYVNCMSVLIEHKADPNAQDNEGMTALHWACSKGHFDAVKLLLEYNAFPNHMEFTEDRYTPLDYALMGEHHDVAQFMIEQGSLSITGIQEIAASKIQSSYRGFSVRKNFKERKQLMMKHEQLKKDAAKKKADDEYKKKVDSKHKKEIMERRRKALEEEKLKEEEDETKSKDTKPHKTTSLSLSTALAQKRITDAVRAVARMQTDAERRRRLRNMSEDEKLLLYQKERHEIAEKESERLEEFERKWAAAKKIQKGWKYYKFIKKSILGTAKEAIRLKRLAIGEEEWMRHIAALTIQLAWRKYYRKKILGSITRRQRKVVHMYDPSAMAAKQAVLVEKIYGESLVPGEWLPYPERAVRPADKKYIPSPAALSYNFAVDHYNPPVACASSKIPALSEKHGRTRPKSNKFSTSRSEESLNNEIHKLKLSDKSKKKNYSYNMKK